MLSRIRERTPARPLRGIGGPIWSSTCSVHAKLVTAGRSSRFASRMPAGAPTPGGICSDTMKRCSRAFARRLKIPRPACSTIGARDGSVPDEHAPRGAVGDLGQRRRTRRVPGRHDRARLTDVDHRCGRAVGPHGEAVVLTSVERVEQELVDDPAHAGPAPEVALQQVDDSGCPSAGAPGHPAPSGWRSLALP
jgi:hypothetical protein